MNSTRRLIILIVIGIIAVFGVISIRNWVTSETPTEATPEVVKPRIMIAKRDIPPGVMVQPATDLDWQEVAPEELKEEHLKEGVSHIEDYNGAITRRQLHTGEALTIASITKAGEGGFMSAVLEPGMRAVSIAVTATSGNAGFLSPGDRVDLILTHRVRAASASNSEGSVVSETFIRDVRVIAVDQQLDNPENKAILAKTVTIEVSAHQAEQIAVAGDLGKISFVLRGLAVIDNKPAAADDPTGADAAATSPADPGYTRDSDVSGALGGGVSSTIRVFRGDQVETISVQ